MTRTDSEDIVTVGTPFRTIAAVTANEPHRVLVTWKDNGETYEVNLAPTIFAFRLYAPLRNDKALFDTVHVVDDHVIAWGEDDAIDMHALELERLSGEAMETGDFRAFLDEMHWTRDTAAAQLGMSRRTIGYYATGTPIPRYIALACAQLRARQSSLGGTNTAAAKRLP